MLPEIIKDRLDLEIDDQLTITLFPDDEGQPSCDIIKVSLKEIEGKITCLFLTPDEALNLSSALNSAVQMYMFNQEQYRKEILEPREKIAKNREKKNVTK